MKIYKFNTNIYNFKKLFENYKCHPHYLNNLCIKFLKNIVFNNTCDENIFFISSFEKIKNITYNKLIVIPIDKINKDISYGNYINISQKKLTEYYSNLINEDMIINKNIYIYISWNKQDKFKKLNFKDEKEKWLIYGLKGYIGQQLIPILKKYNIDIIEGIQRAENYIGVEQEILKHKPDHIISIIGRMYGNNVFSIKYLENKDKLRLNINDNLFAPITLANLSNKHNIHFTYFSSACIFSYDKQHTIECKEGFKDIDNANYFGSNYVTVKGFTDKLMQQYNNVLNLRIRMTMNSDKDQRNLLHKIINFNKIHNFPNSMTILSTLFDIYIDMIKNKYTGTFNFCNKGAITFDKILNIYNKIKNKNKTWEIINDNSRANNYLNIEMLELLYPNKILHITEAVKNIIMEY